MHSKQVNFKVKNIWDDKDHFLLIKGCKIVPSHIPSNMQNKNGQNCKEKWTNL